MEKQEFEDKSREFRKAMSEFKKTGRISECFYHDKSQCKGPIKQAHSIQRNGRLSIIEGDVNGNKVVYTFTEAEFDEFSRHTTLKPIGKGIASTFFGFCDHHDSVLFSPIENNPFNESDEHCFLHSYRAFAHSYHRKKEELKAYETDSAFTKLIPQDLLQSMINAARISVAESENDKHKLDTILEKKAYDELEYFIHVLPELHPIACSSQISPYYSYKGQSMNNHLDPNVPFSNIMLTVLPDFDQTIIIMACFPEDSKGVNFLDELSQLPEVPLSKAISSLLTNCAENTFFAPALWNALEKSGQKLLCNELDLMVSDYYVPSSFHHAKINLLDRKYSAKRLKI